MHLLAPFILQNFQKILRANPIFCHEQISFGTNYFYFFHLPIGPFHCAKFKKILAADPELWGCAIFGPKMVHLLQTNLFLDPHLPISPFHWAKKIFRKPVNEPCFFHSYLSICQKSKSDICLLVKYWWLKKAKSHWPRAIFGYNFRTRFFSSMPFSQNLDEP